MINKSIKSSQFVLSLFHNLHLRRYTPLVQYLIEKGSYLSHKGVGGMDALHVAIRAGNVKMAFLLLSGGSYVDSLCGDNETSFHWCLKVIYMIVSLLCVVRYSFVFCNASYYITSPLCAFVYAVHIFGLCKCNSFVKFFNCMNIEIILIHDILYYNILQIMFCMINKRYSQYKYRKNDVSWIL